MDFDTERLLRILPHRPPFLLVDRVTAVEPRKSARAIKCVTVNEPALVGHFPDKPVFPGVLVLEALAQLTGVLAYASESWDPARKAFHFVGIHKAKFRVPVRPGDRLELEVDVIERRSNIWRTNGTATVDESIAVTAEILAAISDRD